MRHDDEGIKLANGKMLFKAYGKYCPNLTLICPDGSKPEDFRVSEGSYSGPEIPDCRGKREWVANEAYPKEQLRHFDGSAWAYPGAYRKNAKGTDIFEFGGPRSHVLVSVNWGGAYSQSRGEAEVKIPEPEYHRCASSNGGGTGYTYFIFSAAKFDAIGRGLTEDDF